MNGKVENYLGDILNSIINTLKRKSVEAMGSVKTEERFNWIQNNISQVVLLINNVVYGNNVETKLEEVQQGKSDALKSQLSYEVERLTGLIKLVQG